MTKPVRIYPIAELDLDFRVDTEHGELPELTPALDRRVAELWHEATIRRGHALFNGRMLGFAAEPETPGAAALEFTEYRRFLAQLEDPSLYAQLNVNPLAVTGLIECKDGILIGKRGEVTQDPGLWEVLPSGGIGEPFVGADGEVDLARQLRAEFEEEVGPGLPEFENVAPAYWLQERSTHVVDIVLRATLASTLFQVLDRFGANPNHEYRAIDAIPVDGVAERLKAEREVFSETTLCILDAVVGGEG